MDRPEFTGEELNVDAEYVTTMLKNAPHWLTENRTIEDFYCRVHRNRDGSFTVGGGHTTIPI